jgi:2-(1,2-epoxy-1,2-dihydrophenyl)acetyl-CoA isomerase
MSEYEQLEVDRDGRVQIIRFNRPDQMNALSPTMSSEFVDAIERANDDPEVGAIVSTGNGRAYCAGADIGRFEQRQSGELGQSEPRRRSAWDPDFLSASKPIIGAINGVAAGAGLTGPLHFDTLLASTNARFSMRFAAIGMTPELESTWLLPKIVGLHRANEMMLTGRVYSAEQALQLGLVSRLVEPEELLQEAVALAAEIATNSDDTLRQIKRLVWLDLIEHDFEVTRRRSGETFRASVSSLEAREATRAFREKRPARYHDREYMAKLADEVRDPS